MYKDTVSRRSCVVTALYAVAGFLQHLSSASFRAWPGRRRTNSRRVHSPAADSTHDRVHKVHLFHDSPDSVVDVTETYPAERST
ncbi:hypothetical protein BV25DRAFT_1736422 [Artomyces pyxidatus]|uniref:Uncharacterized protein n=1 Tax=Artomyces pyxidatus TaxID=48021 RepID=A0ACB8SIS5_9AGAM|nr:hypothetical protein BV25DRAFT_1736422 [Artomyces pyxidatus]